MNNFNDKWTYEELMSKDPEIQHKAFALYYTNEYWGSAKDETKQQIFESFFKKERQLNFDFDDAA
jgi:hypothetical protein